MERQQVLEVIYDAFPEQPVPKPQIFSTHVHPQDRSNVQIFLSELEGKSWRSLSSEFCAKWRHSFSHLQPQAYGYYIPALLTNSLSSGMGDTELMYRTVCAINPSFEAMSLEGCDTSLRTHQTAFTEAQYRAVCAFLGLAFDEGDRFRRFQAAQGLRWGWNQFDTPALKAANAHLHTLRTFSYPESEDPQIAVLCREIRAAFAATPYPGDEALCPSVGEEPGEIAMGLRGVPWQSAHPHLLDCCNSALSFLSGAGFRYYLPAFLLVGLLLNELNEFDYYGNGDPVFHLTYGLYDKRIDEEDLAALSDFTGSGFVSLPNVEGINRSPQSMQEMFQKVSEIQNKIDWSQYSIQRFTSFNREERTAIIHYLEYRAEDEFQAVKIHQTLEDYWRPSLHSGEV